MSAPPHLFADLALSQRLERAEAESNAKFVEARAKVSPESKAAWIEVAGAYAMFDGIASPLTQTFGLGLFDAVSARDLETLERFFQERGAPVFHEVSPLADSALVASLPERSYHPIEFTNVMYRQLRLSNAEPSTLSSRLHVRPIEPDEGALWAETTVKGWSEYPEFSDYLAALAPISTRREGGVSFIVEQDSHPIATGAMSLHGGVGLLAGACTIPEARRQGAQRALLDYRLQYAAAQGCDVAMMCAQPGSASQRNAERQGFRIAYTRIKWQLALPAS